MINMRCGKAARMEFMKKLEEWKKNVDKHQKSVNCVNNCGYDENNCPVPVRFCNCCINKNKCNCQNKEIDVHLKFTTGGSYDD